MQILDIQVIYTLLKSEWVIEFNDLSRTTDVQNSEESSQK